VQYPLSQQENAALARYVAGVRQQLQDVSDLLTTRYGRESGIAEVAAKTLVSCTLLQHELVVAEHLDEESTDSKYQPVESSPSL
jgi:hypothetical protein